MFQPFVLCACIFTGTRGFGSKKLLTRDPYPLDPTRKPDGFTRTRVLPYALLLAGNPGVNNFLVLSPPPTIFAEEQYTNFFNHSFPTNTLDASGVSKKVTDGYDIANHLSTPSTRYIEPQGVSSYAIIGTLRIQSALFPFPIRPGDTSSRPPRINLLVLSSTRSKMGTLTLIDITQCPISTMDGRDSNQVSQFVAVDEEES
ncbi:hypothetical protein B0H13DRAFT_2318139 [Mycena leptocephala]|nr:hypothetical protein B0H13DRAFT_2318139 [Mycena leptocephala]